jgi:hypothetical protein
MSDVHVPTEEKSDDSKDSFYEELEQVFDYFPKYNMKILLGDSNAKLGGKIFSGRQSGMKVYMKILQITVLGA